MKDASIVIPAFRDYEKLQKLIAGLVGNFEVIVVDNSEQPLYQNPPSYITKYLHGFHYVLDGFVKQYQIGYLAAREIGYQHATCDPVILMDTDLVLPEGWFKELKTLLDMDPNVGLVGPRFKGKKTHDLQHVPEEGGVVPLDKPYFDINDPTIPQSTNPAPEGTLNWNQFLTDPMLCWRKKCLDQVRDFQYSFPSTFWLANCAYRGSPGLFHYPLGTFSALKHGWRVLVSNKVIVKHG